MRTLDIELAESRIVPVVVASGADEGLRAADALNEGGIPIAELTFRVEGAADAIRAVARERPDILVGAGTVVTTEQVELAADAGAHFLVSPGTSETVIKRAHELDLPIVPGVATPSDIIRALDLGITTVKLFPAAAVGGLPTLKAFAAPFPQVRFVPTGGISEGNAPDWLAHPAVLAIGGSWMVERALIAAGNWEEITRRSASAQALVTQIPKEASS